jgi:predicted Zn-dependent protease
MLHVSRGRIDEALKVALAVRERQPEDARLNDLVGSVYMKKDQPLSALPYFGHAVRLSPDEALYRYHIGFAYRQAGEFMRSRQELSRALEIDPASVHADEARAALGITRKRSS